MSGVLGVFTRAPDRRPADETLLHRLLSRMRARGRDCRGVWRGAGAALGVARNEWERQPAFSGDTLVVRQGELAVAADASLYYRDDLRHKLSAAGADPLGTSPSYLILAAYRAWGADCARHLEGDFAFILWDARARRLCCARDFAGSRPLFYAPIPDGLIVASTLGALTAHPACPGAWNDVFLAETAANLRPPADETAYASLHALPAGRSLTWDDTGAVAVTRHWDPPAAGPRPAPSFAEAAVELRERLTRAVTERLAPEAITSVWMSGGRDSPAVFAAGQAALRGNGHARQLRPVSISYPPGDSGREDELITAIAEYWKTPVDWLDIRELPFFDRPGNHAARRDEPYAPLHETVTRAVARRSRTSGARVVLDGWGGDHLFDLPPLYLADLARSGRWMALGREWRALGLHDARLFVGAAITPLLSPPLLTVLARLRGGRPLPDVRHRWIPDWMDQRRVEALRQRQQRLISATPAGGTLANRDLHRVLTAGTAARVRGWLTTVALEEGLEARSPLYDARVIELAVHRPARERRSGRDTKLLLRAAMRGLLPERVLAPRAVRTGTTGHQFRHAMESHYAEQAREMLECSVLAELGIIDPAVLRRSAEVCLTRSWNSDVAAALFATLQTELWLRARVRGTTRDNRPAQTSDDGQHLAVLPPGKPARLSLHQGGTRCTTHRSSSASELSGS